MLLARCPCRLITWGTGNFIGLANVLAPPSGLPFVLDEAPPNQIFLRHANRDPSKRKGFASSTQIHFFH